MKVLPYLCSLLLTMAGVNGETHYNGFLEDVIQEWGLLSPMIVVNEDFPDLCITSQLALCISCTEPPRHIALVLKESKQDSMIFGPGLENLCQDLDQLEPSVFRSNKLVFAPMECSDLIRLRLDSNIVFYQQEKTGKYSLFDKFAVKDGPAITIKLGQWNTVHGMRFQNHRNKNRWDRRTDLRGAELVNSLASIGPWSVLLRDAHGNVVGSKGVLQNSLFYIADKLNLTIKTVEMKYDGP